MFRKDLTINVSQFRLFFWNPMSKNLDMNKNELNIFSCYFYCIKKSINMMTCEHKSPIKIWTRFYKINKKVWPILNMGQYFAKYKT